MRSVRRWFVIGGLVLCGCAGTPYVKQGGSVMDEKRDGIECRALAEQGVPPGGLLRGVQVEGRYKTCLEGRGYAPQPQS